MFAGSSFRPMAQNVRLAQAAPPTPTPAPPTPTPAPSPITPVGPVVVPIAPAPTPVVVTEQAPTGYGPLLTVAAIAAGIAAVILLTRESKSY